MYALNSMQGGNALNSCAHTRVHTHAHTYKHANSRTHTHAHTHACIHTFMRAHIPHADPSCHGYGVATISRPLKI